MQFFVAILAAAMASAAAAEVTVTVYACSTSSGIAKPTTAVVAPTKSVVASTGVAPTPTGQPQFTGAASMNAPALGLIVAGGLALFI